MIGLVVRAVGLGLADDRDEDADEFVGLQAEGVNIFAIEKAGLSAEAEPVARLGRFLPGDAAALCELRI